MNTRVDVFKNSLFLAVFAIGVFVIISFLTGNIVFYRNDKISDLYFEGRYKSFQKLESGDPLFERVKSLAQEMDVDGRDSLVIDVVVERLYFIQFSQSLEVRFKDNCEGCIDSIMVVKFPS